MTKDQVISKMNKRNGTDHCDYLMLLTDLRRSAERLERKAAERVDGMYAAQAMEARADYNEALAAE